LSLLFLGETNDLRSQMAEAFLRALAPAIAEAHSAGLQPAGQLHPALLELMGDADVSLAHHHPKGVADLVPGPFDVIVTMSSQVYRASLGRPVLTATGAAADGAADGDGGDSFGDGGDSLTALRVGTPIVVQWDLDLPAAQGLPRGENLSLMRDRVRQHVEGLVHHGYLGAFLAERRRLRLLVDALETGIVVHDEARRIYLFNKAMERMTGRPRSEVLGRDCHELFGPDGMCGSRCAFQQPSEGAVMTPREYRVPFVAGDGTQRRLRFQATPLAIHQGHPSEVVAQVTDVTELDQLRWNLTARRSLHGMIGDAPAMRGVFEIIRQVAPSDYSVLVAGESGTGKELAARAIHMESRRAGGPFVPINCGALPEHILESELFGHVRGAFTGAIRDKKGRFELAHGGTLFLDEVGELTPAFQVKLLRVLQEMRFERVGGERTVAVDVRIISATNRDLRQMVQKREFREDLFYRLCVVPIALPPLRERRGDVPLLVRELLERIKEETNKAELTLASTALDLILAYRWPGNVRELINALQFAAIRCAGDEIRPEHLPPELSPSPLSLPQAAHLPPSAREAPVVERPPRKKLTEASVMDALAQTQGNKVQAAKILGVGRATLYRFLNDHPLPGDTTED
jgi:PAS domain S-box-containing protein